MSNRSNAAMEWATRLSRLSIWALALLSIGAFVVVSLQRLFSPCELGNTEGAWMDHVVRLSAGQPFYVEPTLRFIPFASMPLYPALVALPARLFGPAFWEARLLSFLAALALAALAGWIVTRETGRRSFGAAAAGLLLMGQGLTRGGYDRVQPDSLMLALTFAGLATLRFGSGMRGAVVAALLCSAAFFTEPHALVLALVALPWLWLADRPRFAPFALTLVIGCGGGFLLLRLWLGPWFEFYAADVPGHWLRFSQGRAQDFLGHHVLGRLGLLSVSTLLAMAAAPPLARRLESLWWWVAFGAVGAGLIATLDPYADVQRFMPTLAAFAMVGPIAVDRLARALAGDRGGRGEWMAWVVLALQFVPLLYPLRALTPRPVGAQARERFLGRLRAASGLVLVPFHGLYSWQARGESSLHVLALDDVIRARGNRLLRRDPSYFDRMFDALRRGPGRPMIVSDFPLERCGDVSAPLWASLTRSYRLADSLGDAFEDLRPLAGNTHAPRYLYVPVEGGATSAPPSP